MALKLDQRDKSFILNSLHKEAKEVESYANNYFGYVPVKSYDWGTKDIDPYVDHSKQRNFMNVRWQVDVIDRNGIYGFDITIHKCGLFMHDDDRFRSEQERKLAQVDPFLDLHNMAIKFLPFPYYQSPGWAYITKSLEKKGLELENMINTKYRKVVCFARKRIVHEPTDRNLSVQQCVEFYNLRVRSPKNPIGTSKDYLEKESERILGKKVNLDAKIPTFGSVLLRKKTVSEKADAIWAEVKKDKEASESRSVKEIMQKYRKNPFKKIANFFTKIKNSIYRAKHEKELFGDTPKKKSAINISSINILMCLPAIIFVINIILVAILQDKFNVSITSNFLGINNAFSFYLSGLVISAMNESPKFIVMVLLIIAIVFAFIIDLILSLLHAIAFAILALIVLIYGLGFVNIIGIIITSIGLPILFGMLSSRKTKSILISILINIAVGALFILVAYLLNAPIL